MAWNDPSFNQDTPRETDRFRLKRDILITENSEAELKNDKDNSNNGADTDKDYEGEETNVMFEGQRRYGKPPGGFRHNNRFGRDRKMYRSDDKGHEYNDWAANLGGKNSGTKVVTRCFNCRSPECMFRKCPDPKNEERIKANLESWHRLKNLNCPLREKHLTSIDADPLEVSEALTAESSLEHVYSNAQTVNFFSINGSKP